MKGLFLKKVLCCVLCALLLVTFLASCGKENAQVGDSSNVTAGTSNPTIDNTQNVVSPTNPWIVEVFYGDMTGKWPNATNFYEGLAFVLFDGNTYLIDRSGNLKADLGCTTAVLDDLRFYDGVCIIDGDNANGGTDYIIDTEGKKTTAGDLGGTALYTERIYKELLAGGYIVVDKVTSAFDDVTYESAIFNTKLEQVQTYSAELYELFHVERSFSEGLSFYDGYVYYGAHRKINSWESEKYYQTYHIATNTFAEYSKFPQTYVNEMDFAHYREASYSEVAGMYRDDALILDLSQYTTLSRVEFVEDLGVAKFCNEEGISYFSVMDTEGELQFDPIQYSTNRMGTDGMYFFNGNVVMVYSHTGMQDNVNTYKISTYDTEGNCLGNLEMRSEKYCTATLGQDTIVVSDGYTYVYYDINLKPLFTAQ